MYERLKAYYEQHGHTCIRRDKQLEDWVYRQRCTVSRPNRRLLLEAIGFPFKESANSSSSSSPPSRPVTRKRSVPDSNADGEMQNGRIPHSECSIRRARTQEVVVENARNDATPPVAHLTRDGLKASSHGSVSRSSAAKVGLSFQNNAPTADCDDAYPLVWETQDGLKASSHDSLNEAAPESVGTHQQNGMQYLNNDDVHPVGTDVLNFFPGHGWYKGIIRSSYDQTYIIVYEDGNTDEFPCDSPILDALVELAKTHPNIGVATTSLHASGTAGDNNAVPIWAECRQDRSGERRHVDCNLEDGEMKHNERCTTAGMDAAEKTAEHDVNGTTNSTDLVMGLENKVSVVERMARKSNEPLTKARGEFQKASTLLRGRERLSKEKADVIANTNARILDLKLNQFMTGSVAQRVLYRLQSKM